MIGSMHVYAVVLTSVFQPLNALKYVRWCICIRKGIDLECLTA